jgi:hypothetical protein
MADRESIVGSRRSSVARGVPSWRSSYTLPPFTVRKGAITVDPALQDMVRGYIEAVAPALADAYATELDPIAQEAYDRWPIKSGLSKSLLSLEYTTDGNIFTRSLVDRAEYAGSIRWARGEGNGLVANTLVFEPVEQAGGRIAARTATNIAAT